MSCTRIALAAGLLSIATLASAQVVLSRVFPGGGVASATYSNDYVELLNTSTEAYVLTGHSLQYGNQSTGEIGSSASTIYAFPSGTTIPAKRYLLVQCGTTHATPPPVPGWDLDATAVPLDIGPTGGKLALVKQATGLNAGSAANPISLPDPRIMDLVAWGNGSNAEGGARVSPGVSIPSTSVLVRKDRGQQDTNNNAADFEVLTTTAAGSPNNLSSTAVPVQVSAFTVD